MIPGTDSGVAIGAHGIRDQNGDQLPLPTGIPSLRPSDIVGYMTYMGRQGRRSFSKGPERYAPLRRETCNVDRT
jgi:hypothetical protein